MNGAATTPVKGFLALNPMHVPSTIQIFNNYMTLLNDKILGSDTIIDRISNLTALLVEEVKMDTTYQLQYHFGYDDVNGTLAFFHQYVGDLVKFIQERNEYLR